MKLVKHTSLIILLFCLNFSISAQKKWTLEECITYAKQHNVNVVKQNIQNEILKKDIVIAKGNYLPNANFNASQNFSLGNSFDVSTSVGKSESRSNNFSLSSSMVIFNGFSNKYNLEKSKLLTQKGKADTDKIRFDISLNITNKYLQVLFNKEILKIAQEQFEISQNNYLRLQKLFKIALVNKRELLEMEATLASDKKEIIIAKNKITTSIIELKEMLDVREITNFDVIESVQENSILLSKRHFDVSNLVLDNNPQIKATRLDVDLKKKDIQISKANFYPTINFNYSYSSNYYHIQGGKDEVFNQQTNEFVENSFLTQLNNNRTHYLGFSASIPIFNRFSTKENYKKTLDQLRISEIDLENNKTVLRNKIRIAHNDYNTAIASMESLKVAFKTQKEAFKISNEQYKRGNITNYQFLESKSKLIKNNSEYIKSKYELIFKEKILGYYFEYEK